MLLYAASAARDNALAIYAAVVGTPSMLVAGASLGWQIHSWRRQRLSLMRVFLRVTEDRFAVLGPWFVTVTAVNQSDHQVRVVTMTLSQDDRPVHHTLLENAPSRS